jgi:hypothetical protein
VRACVCPTWHSAPVIYEADSATPLCVRSSVCSSVCLTDGQGRGRAAVTDRAGQGGRGRPGQARQKDLGNFRIWFSGHGFQDLGSQLWGLDFHTRSFQDQNLKIFRMWFSGCEISILGPGFHTRGFKVAFGHGHPLVSFKRTTAMMYEILVFLSYSQLCSWRSQRLLMMFFKGVPHNTSFYYNILCPTFWGIGFRVLEARWAKGEEKPWK